MVQSHIQMPRQVLNNFVNENGQLFYYDFTKKKLGRGYPKSLYTEFGYYSDGVEKFLASEIESQLGMLLSFLKRTSFAPGQEPPANYVEIAFNYVYSLMSRSPSLQKVIDDTTCFFQLLPKTDRNDYAAYNGFYIAKEKGLLRQYSISFMCNISTEQLVLPTGGMTIFQQRIICPISPTRAIVLDPIKMSEESVNIVPVYEIEDEEVIQLINRESFVQEMKRDKKYIVADNKKSLDKLIENIIL